MSGIVIAGTHSGCGKTTVVLGLLAALKKKGLAVQSFKAGPDFIDSGLHRIITGRPSRNLDLWMCGRDYVRDCYGKNSADADISVVEGVMGLYDGRLSTAALAAALDLPVVLVIDAYGMAESAGAVAKGFRDQGLEESKEQIKIAGVIFNRVASENHYRRLQESVREIPVFGYLPRDLDFEIPHRHLGLTTAEENPITEENIRKLAETVLSHIDVEKVMDSANGSGKCACAPESLKASSRITRHTSRPVIAVAYDRAFCFYYEDNLDLLREAGAEIVFFSPLSDTAIPEKADGIYIGGGYPELRAEQLSLNTPMLTALRNWAEADRPMYAECGGLMYLSRGVHDFEGNFFMMTGIFPFETEMKKGRAHLGYRKVSLKSDCILGTAGASLRGHEFHYSSIRNHPPFEANTLQYTVQDSSGNVLPEEGYRTKNTVASYIHIHFGSNPAAGRNFINFITGER